MDVVMKVLACGSRSWTDYGAIQGALSGLVEERGPFVVIHGAARGADRLAGAAARRLDFEVIEYPADWKRYGRRAGYVRNEEMLAAGPDLVVAFHRDGSRGTAHTIRLARDKGVEVVIYEAGSVAS